MQGNTRIFSHSFMMFFVSSLIKALTACAPNTNFSNQRFYRHDGFILFYQTYNNDILQDQK